MDAPDRHLQKKSAEEWYVGEDAYKYTLVGEGVIVDKLLSLAAKEGTSTIGGVKYGGMELLQRFLGSILAMVRAEYAGQRIDELVISLKNLEMKLLEGLTASVEVLGSREEMSISQATRNASSTMC